MSDLHHTMLRCGYKFTSSQKLTAYKQLKRISKKNQIYIKDYITSEGIFKIALIFKHDPATHLPLAYIIEKPEKFDEVLLPHINFGWYLCYVQEMEADWNPNDLNTTYTHIDHQIQKTLENSINSLSNGATKLTELEGEFSAYWQADFSVYLLSDYNNFINSRGFFTLNKSTTDQNLLERVLFHANHKNEYHKLLMIRGLYGNEPKQYNTTVIKVRPNRLSGVNWPPKNSKELFDWLSVVDHNAKSILINYFLQHPFKNHIIFLEIENQETLGLILELNLAATQLSTYTHSKRKTGKKHGRKIQLNAIAAVLSSKYSFNDFKRISFIRADQQTILSRNRPRPEIGDLSNKKIALIGCGTIGGYLASLLLRSGAGIGKGTFDLYDFDTLSPHNYGRHALNSCDFGKNKASALQESLESSIHLATNIRSFECSFSFHKESFNFYDLIIDVTGRPPISKRLAYLIRDPNLEKKPILIHGFNDGNGRASKVFIDYLNGCINCLWTDPAICKDGIDHRFSHLTQLNEKRISCGNTYTPYDAAVSIITAALIQEAALSTLEDNRSWNYKEHMFEGGRTKKPTLITSTSYCDICNAKKRVSF